MKKFIHLVCAIAFCFNVQAQEHTIYYENFDANNGGWLSSTAGGSNGSWFYTSSGAPLIAEGGYWRINPFNNYQSNSETYLTSPNAISTTGFTNVTIYLDVRYDTSSDDDDGMQIQYTTNAAGTGGWTRLGNIGDGNNWYNDTDVDGIANDQDGWSDRNTESSNSNSKFLEASLPSSVLNNQATLWFRVLFGSDSSSTDDGVAIDNVIIKGDYISAPSNPTYGPGSVNSDLKLWLKADAGTSTTTDNTALITWGDQAFDNDAVSYNTNTPIFKNNATDNINFNPALDFNRGSSNLMKGKGGYWTHDYWVVVQTNNTFDKTTANTQVPLSGKFTKVGFSVDGTGLGFGRISSRFNSDNLVSHLLSSYNNGTSGGAVPGVDSYGRSYAPASISSLGTDVMIFNVKSNTSVTPNISEIYYNGKRVDNHAGTTGSSGTGNDLLHAEFDNLRYTLGAGQFSINGHALSSFLDGKVSEVVSYSNANSALDQQKIQSYLAIKYGVTLKQSGSPLEAFDREGDVDYVNSNGDVIWDVLVNSGYNYDIAGIGRDNASELIQKQSASENKFSDGTGLTSGFLTMGLTTIYNTNNENISTNPTTFNDREFLVWGNNGADLDLAATVITVNMSAGITPSLTTNVTFTAMQRIWKVVETGGNIPSVQVSIPQNAVRNISPPGSYLMFISDTNVFDPTADYRVMVNDGFGNLITDYNFDGTKFITFGYAPQVVVERSIYFDGVVDYIEMDDVLDLNTSNFTISAWIKRDTGTTNASIVSKRNAINTEGYDLRINGSGNLQFTYNGGAVTLTSSVAIPENEWHQVAVIYNNGTATLYIDGVPDTTASSLTAPVSTIQIFLIAAADGFDPNTTDYFAGNIDEVRVWDTALALDQLHYVMNQEIEENTTFANGRILPATITKNEVSSIPWSNLAGYYPMSIYTYTNTNDESSNNNQGALRNLDTVDRQTAPLPYQSQADGAWNTDATWLNNTVQTLPNAFSIVDGTIPIDWNIVETNHNITIGTYTGLGRERSVLGLMVNSGDLQINGNTVAVTGNGLTVTHYLNLDGTIDLEGESQLIQTTGSDLDFTSSGTLERDQQGTADTYTYNYWSAPVGISNITTNNNSYTLPDVMRDGVSNINFSTSGYDGTNTSPIGIADYWIWKFSNQLSDDYSSWQHVRSTGTLLAGEGFTMKGPGTGTILTDQNYVFLGKPNNGDITLPLSAVNDYLVGNPYPSAIDAEQFILDNGPLISGVDPITGAIITGATTGTLYFWEHWGGASHNLGDYQGGYGTYTLAGGVPSASQGTNDPDVGTGGTPTKTPGRYIPVSQGFFVVAEAAGTINFNNGQRVFQREGVTSTFMRSANQNTNTESTQDLRMKIRIGFNSINTIHRQLLLTVDDNTTTGVDWGYDGKSNEDQIDDLYWMIGIEKYNIQSVDIVNTESIFPLGIHTNIDGLNNITIDKLENVSESLEILVHDKVLNIYHDLRISDYEFFLPFGEYLDRFEIVFNNTTLSDTDNEFESLDTHFSNALESIIIINPTLKSIKSVELFNMLGQSIYVLKNIPSENYSEFKTNNISSGTYIIKLETETGTLTKKVLVE